MDPKELFQKLKESKLAPAILILILVPLVLLLMLTGYCLGPLVAGMLLYGLPHAFGIKNLKTVVKMGLLVLVISGFFLGILTTYFLYEQVYFYEQRPLKNSYLADGLVDPYLGNPGDTFNYTVRYTGSDPVENVTVYVNITDASGKEIKNLTLMRSGNVFYNYTTMEDGVFAYYFTIYLPSKDKWLKTKEPLATGPITVDYSEMQGVNIVWGIINTMFFGGIFFVSAILLFRMFKTPKPGEGAKPEEKDKGKDESGKEEDTGPEEEAEGEEEEKTGQEKVEPKEEFECTECGASVPADAQSCPSCDEEFEDD